MFDNIIILILIILLLNMIANIISYSINSRKKSNNLPFLSVLVPVRNEEERIRDCLTSLLNQDYPDYEIIVLDDNSEDNSGNIIKDLAKDNKKIKYIKGLPLSEGWAGKCFACYQLAQYAKGEWLLFTDADTIHKKNCLSTMVSETINRKVDFLTLLPYKTTNSFIGYIFLPIINFFFVVLFPSFLLNSPIKFFSFALGPFILIKKEIYWEIDGHKSVYDKIVEDVELARKVKEYGRKLSIVNGSDYMSVFYYHNFNELWNGFSKNFAGAIGNSLFIAIFLIIFATVVFLSPLFNLLYSLYYAHPITTSMIIKLILIWLIWAGLSIFYKENIFVLFFYPFCLIITFSILINSFYVSFTNKLIVWKKRNYNDSIKLNNFLYIFSKFFYYFIEIILGFLIGKIFFQYKIIGKEKIKNIKGRAIFVANHCHYLDCFLIALSSFPRFLKFAAMSSHFKHPILKNLLPLLGSFPIRIDGKRDPFSFKTIENTLLSDGYIAIFPECHLKHYSKKIGKFRIGAFMFAEIFDAYIVPVSITIAHIYLTNNIKIPFFKKAIIEFLEPRKIQVKDKILTPGITGNEKSFYEIKKNASKEFLDLIEKEAKKIEEEIQESILRNSGNFKIKTEEIIETKKAY
ncbi:MAG TPA: glycosyltransferase [Spirochaetota bacterium]|nr:glycosyltransferase [Spirochaetota bacterium]HOL57546.1 glycosyltransferase [Spirochaetota bacterium]HPP05038.1 glycosyltransferase [Spirochaetota bacterium]